MVLLAFATPGSREKRFSNASVLGPQPSPVFRPPQQTCPVQEAALPCPGSTLFEQSSRQRKSETVALMAAVVDLAHMTRAVWLGSKR